MLNFLFLGKFQVQEQNVLTFKIFEIRRKISILNKERVNKPISISHLDKLFQVLNTCPHKNSLKGIV